MNEPQKEHSLSLEELGVQPASSPQNTPPPPQAQPGVAQPMQAYTPPAVVAQPTATNTAAPQVASVMPQPTGADGASTKSNAKPKHSFWRPIAYGLGGFVLFLVIFNFQLIAQQIGYFLHPPQPGDNLTLQDPNAATASASIVPPESLIIIPKINVSAPIVFADSVSEDVVMKDLESGVVHYSNTANPGEVGNAVIFGHSSNDWWEQGSYKFVFALLNKLAVGDQVQVNYSSRKYIYEVTETKEVQPTEVSVLNQTPSPILTLITCTPPGTSWRRLIVTAKQIQPIPGTPQQPIATADKQSASKPLPGNGLSIGSQIGRLFSNIASLFSAKPTQTQPNQPTQTQHLPEVS